MIELAIAGSSFAREAGRPGISALEGVDCEVKSQPVTRRLIRAVLDCVLVLTLLIIVAGPRLASGSRSKAQTGHAVLPNRQSGFQAIVPARPVVGQPRTLLVDNDILAAMIAAENSALTPPIYFNDLPLIIR